MVPEEADKIVQINLRVRAEGRPLPRCRVEDALAALTDGEEAVAGGMAGVPEEWPELGAAEVEDLEAGVEGAIVGLD